MGKPIVEFDISKCSFETLLIGSPALIWPINHPSEHVSNTCLVRTSPIINIMVEEILFETENTIYVGVFL